MTETGQPYGEVAIAFAEIARALFSDLTVRGTLQRIVDFAVATVEGCDAAGISLLTGTEVTTPVWSDAVALEIDTVQYETGEGPCLDAITNEAAVYAEDLAEDPRWPSFGPRAVAFGMRSLLSCRLSADGTLGALNLYARLPRAYGAIDRTKALIFAVHAGIALGAAAALEDATVSLSSEIHRVENLRAALTSRQVIGQAEGILRLKPRTGSWSCVGLVDTRVSSRSPARTGLTSTSPGTPTPSGGEGVPARSDLDVLAARGRRVLPIHLGPDVESGLQTLRDVLGWVLNS